MLHGQMSTHMCLSGGEWLMRPSSPENEMQPSKALSEYTAETNKNSSHMLLTKVISNRDITALF